MSARGPGSDGGGGHSEDDARDQDEDDQEEDSSEEEGVERDAEGTEDEGARAETSKVFEVTEETFGELRLSRPQITEVQATWAAFLRGTSRDAAGEAIYAAIFDASPSLQVLFKTPRAVMAMRFFAGLSNMVNALNNPKALKVIVETMGFQHLELEVTAPRIDIIRGALLELLTMELTDRMTDVARDGWASLLNYSGGAFIYVRVKYAERLRILASSWQTANSRTGEEGDTVKEKAHEEKTGGNNTTGSTEEEGEEAEEDGGKGKSGRLSNNEIGNELTNAEGVSGTETGDAAAAGRRAASKGKQGVAVPQTFNEMFTFNAAVMGFGDSNVWMDEILESFDAVVLSVTNPGRLQEECDLISLRIAQCKGMINLDEFKRVMLASLRSLVPKEWNSAHEVAWGWLWETVERMIKTLLGKLSTQRRALEAFLSSLDETQVDFIRKEVFSRLFAIAPATQDYIKVSAARLHIIADKIVAMSLDIYKDPRKLVQDISALGLRHVGYGIPTELFGPFVTNVINVISSLTDDELAQESFRWSTGLIARILVRVVGEGSTVVMRAINANSARQLQRAVASAPRAKRAKWVLQVEVGIQSISPLVWALQTGAVDAAKAIVQDLVTIRADRDTYYFGVDQLFLRHPDIIKRLVSDAPSLLPCLLDGLIWRSRVTDGGLRRVNYYFKSILVDDKGDFAKTIEWLVDYADPKVICHPIIVLVMDMVWSRLASWIFLSRKIWFVVTLLCFILDHSILPHIDKGEQTTMSRALLFSMHMCIYILSVGQLLYTTTRSAVVDIKHGRYVRLWGRLHVPEFLTNWQDALCLVLAGVLLLMFTMEPTLHCLNVDAGAGGLENAFRDDCAQAEHLHFPVSVVGMIGTGLYFVLLVDLSVFSHKVWAFVLVCSRMVSEVMLFAGALAFCILMFCCSIAALKHDNEGYRTIPDAALALFQISMSMSGEDHFAKLTEEPVLFIAVSVFIGCTMIFLLNLLIAQLSCSYTSSYEDNLGHARLNRGKIVVDAMSACPPSRWISFVESLRLDQRLEFTEGDLGMPGGSSVMEPAAANPTTVDMVRRYGGSTAPAMPWPEDTTAIEGEDRLEKMEKLLQKTMKRISKTGSRSGGSMGHSASVSADSAADSQG